MPLCCSMYVARLTQRRNDTLYYGRDPLGRRSLLYAQPANAHLLASAASVESVQAHVPWTEVPCTSLWRLSLRANKDPVPLERCSPYARRLELAPPSLECTVDQALPLLEQVLSESVRLRVQALRDTPRAAPVALLFSGGLDLSLIHI